MKRVTRRSLITYVPVVLVGIVMIVLPLSAVVELPLERRIKDLAGFDYGSGCAPVRHRGTFGAWRPEERLPGPLEEARAVRIGDSAYLAGGVVSQVVDNVGQATSAFDRYDLRTGSLEKLAPLPRRLDHVGAAAHGGDIYVVGGLGDRLEFISEASASMWRYDLDLGRWQALPPMPVARGALGAAFVGDTLYAVGGRNGPTSFDTVEAYDLKRGTWTERAPLPSGRDHLGVAAMGGFLYAVGGRYDGGNELREFLRYDPRRDRWTSLPPLPAGTSGANLERVGRELVISGGEEAEQVSLTGRTFAFNPATDRWRELPSSPRPKHGYASVGYRGRLYVIGGSRCAGSTPVSTIESLRVERPQ